MLIEDEHEAFIKVEDGAVLWRYIDLAKFLSMLQNKGLYFSTIDRLGDPLEGKYTQVNRDIARKQILEVPDLKNIDFFSGEETAKTFFINCWFNSDNESAGMWRSYPGLESGIAIRSTIERVKRSLSIEHRPVRASRVKYIDRRSEAIGFGNLFNLSVSKGSYYAYENEIRLIYWWMENGHDGHTPHNYPDFGVNIRADIDTLIEKVVISPFAPQWFFDMVKSLLINYNLNGIANKLEYSEMKEEAFIV